MPSLMESIISLDVGAQEPWPNDVQLFQPYPMEQILLPDNANCLATQAYLHMCGLPFKIEHRANAEFMSPSGKVPFIKCGAFVVSELEPIVQFVANKGISLTLDFDNEQKSDLRAYMSLIFSVLMNAELYICWCDKRTYNEVTKVRNGSVYPWPLNHYQNWTKRAAVIKKLKLLNWYQKTLGSVYQEVETCCQALSERLEGKEYFFGSKPTEVDALLYGHTYSIFSNPVEFPNLFVIFQRFPNLIIHCRRICLHYTILRYIDFTKTDTDLDLSRESSAYNIAVEKSKTTVLTQIWNYVSMCMYGPVPKIPEHEFNNNNNNKNIPEVVKSVSQFKDICFKKSVDPCIKFSSTFDEEIDSPKSINYLGHKIIQQHLQQDLRNKLSDFTIDTNSDLWSEKDVCYIISDRDLIRANPNKVEADPDDEKQNLERKYSNCSSTSNISEQMNWLHGSSTSTIDVPFSNKFDVDSFTDNKNDTLDEQVNIEIDADNASELDWLTDYTSDTKVDKEIVPEIITFDGFDNAEQVLEPKFSNCSIDGDLDWLHDFTKTTEIPAENPSQTDLVKKCSSTSNTNAWTTFASGSVSSIEISIANNMDSTIELMNEMLNTVEAMNATPTIKKSQLNVEIVDSGSEVTVETYSDNHMCNEDCDNVLFIANDDLFWEDDFSKSISANYSDSTNKINSKSENTPDYKSKTLEKKHSGIKICCKCSVVDKISNESLKKYFSCESCKHVIPVEKLSNVIIAVNQAYPENEFLKLLKSDYDISQFTNSTHTLHNCDERVFEETPTTTNVSESSSAPKNRVFRKCRRLLNRTPDANTNTNTNTDNTMRSDSKILQMYNEKIQESRNKSDNDLENIRTACIVLKSFQTNHPEECRDCNLCKFVSNPSISHSCKCCDSTFQFKSKSMNKFSSSISISISTFPTTNSNT